MNTPHVSRNRGRPPLGDRPLSKAQHASNRREKIAKRLDEASVEIAGYIGALQALHRDLARRLSNTEQVTRAEHLVRQLQDRFGDLLDDLARKHGVPRPRILRPGQIYFAGRDFVIIAQYDSDREIRVVRVKGRNGTARHRAEVRIENPAECGIPIRDATADCRWSFVWKASRFATARYCGELPEAQLDRVNAAIVKEASRRATEVRLHFDDG